VIDPSNSKAIEAFGQASLDFREDGSLIYSTLDGDRIQTIFLTYQLAGDELITNQPSAPHEDRTQFGVTKEGRLVLVFGGVETTFRRES
jgi:hypothetical protein